MGRSTLWYIGFLLGVTVILATAITLSPLAGLAVVLGSLTFITWRGSWAGLTGLFSGFGGFLLLIVLAELWSGDELDNSAIFWFFLIGIVSLIAGWALRFKIGQQVPGAEIPPDPAVPAPTPSETTFPEPIIGPTSSETTLPESAPFPESTSVEMMPSETTFPDQSLPEQSLPEQISPGH